MPLLFARLSARARRHEQRVVQVITLVAFRAGVFASGRSGRTASGRSIMSDRSRLLDRTGERAVRGHDAYLKF